MSYKIYVEIILAEGYNYPAENQEAADGQRMKQGA